MFPIDDYAFVKLEQQERLRRAELQRLVAAARSRPERSRSRGWSPRWLRLRLRPAWIPRRAAGGSAPVPAPVAPSEIAFEIDRL